MCCYLNVHFPGQRVNEKTDVESCVLISVKLHLHRADSGLSPFKSTDVSQTDCGLHHEGLDIQQQCHFHAQKLVFPYVMLLSVRS